LGEECRELIDEVAIREFLHSVYPRLVGGLSLVAGSRAAAEDAVQEAVARAWERSERGADIASLPAWVTTVTLHLARSRRRRDAAERRARARLGARGPSPSDSPEDRMDITLALAALPRRQREVTVLRYYLVMDVKEVADVLGISEGTAKTTLFRARRALARALDESDLEEANDRGEA
jgi:RNA polymerase sigma-70 factor (ECF subfamily)